MDLTVFAAKEVPLALGALKTVALADAGLPAAPRTLPVPDDTYPPLGLRYPPLRSRYSVAKRVCRSLRATGCWLMAIRPSASYSSTMDGAGGAPAGVGGAGWGSEASSPF